MRQILVNLVFGIICVPSWIETSEMKRAAGLFGFSALVGASPWGASPGWP